MKRWKAGIAVITVLAAAVGVAWRVLPQKRAYYTDAGTIREPLTTARVRDVLWEPPARLPDLINSAAEDYEPRQSADGMTLYFVRGKAGQNADIYYASRSPQGWSDPRPLTAINSEADDLGPQPSADGEAIYFYSNRTGGLDGYDLWVSRRGTYGDWRTPDNLGPTVNSEFNDYGPALTPDGKTLYFSSNRPQPGDVKTPDPNAWPATLREDLFHRTYDLYTAAITERGVGEAEPVNSLNTPFNEGAPAVSSFGDFLYFASDRPGGLGGFDLYRSRRIGGGHGAATSLGNAVNTSFNELDPALSMGGFGLDFSSDRPVAGRPADAPREYNLYHTNSREVFVEADTIDRPPIDWAGLWTTVGPNLLWALLALTLLSAMLLLFKGARHRRLSLIARCLLASLAAHALLMLWFNVWHVAAALAGELRHSGPIRVALGGSGHGDSITAQIRGSVSDITAPPPTKVAARRQLIPLAATAGEVRASLPVERQPQGAASGRRGASAVDTAGQLRDPVVPKVDMERMGFAQVVDVPLPPDSALRMRVAEAAGDSAVVAIHAPLLSRAAALPSVQSIAPSTLVADIRPATAAVADVRLVADARAEVADTAPLTAGGGGGSGGALPASLVVALPASPLTLPKVAREVEPVPGIRPAATGATRATLGDVLRPGGAGPGAETLPFALGEGLSGVGTSSVANLAQAVRDADKPLVRAAGLPAPSVPATSVPVKFDLVLPHETLPDVSSGRQAGRASGEDGDQTPMGTIRGVVTDAASGKAVRGAVVQLVLPDRTPLSVKSGADGRYSLVVPPMPEFFALSASRKGFVPATTNVKRSDFEDRGEVVADFRLERDRPTVSATEAVPDVHHLGDDRFDGAINSRFQKQSEGSSFAATFEVDGGLLKSALDRAELRLLVKGVQRRHRIYVNEHLLTRRLDESPEDGSFGEFVAAFDATMLNAGSNTLRIVAAPSAVDIDDFEFVNIRVYLVPSTRASAAGL